MASYKKTSTSSSSTSSKQETTSSKSTSRNVLDEALLNTILGGLGEQMSGEEIARYAENLLRPALNAGLEAAQKEYETAKLTREQEIENLAVQLSSAIEAQNAAYRKSIADVETAALARGMGRSSYTLETMANQGDALSKAVRELTQENARKSEQLQRQITQAAQQSEETKSRLQSDYAGSLAAKIQELTREQQKAYNSNYLTAVSGSMGSVTSGESSTNGTSETTSSSTTKTKGSSSSSSSSSSGSSKSTKKTSSDEVDAVSSAALKR